MGELGSGLRELKKQQTRTAISHVATRLFIERGFDRVTIAEVAAAAEVAKMTVTNHFPRKEDLVFDVHAELVARPARTVAERAAGESAFDALRRAYFAALDRRDALLGFSGVEFARLITESPTLLARLRELHGEQEDALTGVLAEETGAPVLARAAAVQLVGAERVLFHEVLRRTLAGASHDEIAAGLAEVAEQVFALLEPGLGDFARRAGATGQESGSAARRGGAGVG
ncbi:TetR/AcrR family transcriptional regulator [Goodfellowiella coeruleoviolacea]|uniref:Transcriptional regulator, TetR family n=1 Tax=Goodfellowiella coeruleoviolacea TaxID=334858 RepID=A0AAE3KEK9_9PSEU|nr:TetR/AcrR family transcriptional regulator [Goodfellowiella coeruleoviolacea]MCP2163955.1 transcriptional regulator, TetR family [Goodfellowiella coeruleoviolacea]